MRERGALQRAEPWLWTVAFAALLVPLVLGAARVALPQIQSDALVPWRLTSDVLEHGTDVAWMVGGPTFLFPDFPLLVIARAVTPELATGYAVHALLQFALLAAGLSLLVRNCAAAPDPLDLAVGPALAATYLAHVLASGQVVDTVFFPAAHQGLIAAGMLYLAFVARVLRGGAGRGAVAVVGALAALTMVSDALTLTQFLVPATLGAAVLARGRCDPRDVRAVLASTAVGTVAGIALYCALDAASFWEVTKHASAPFVEPLPASIRSLLEDLPTLLAWPDAAMAAVCATLLVFAARRARRDGATPVSRVLLAVLAFAWILSVVVPPLSGRWADRASVRYMLPLWVVPPVAAAVAVLGTWPGRGARRALLAAGLAVSGTVAAVHGTLDAPATPYPPLVREIDAVAAAYGVTEGLGTYWFASLTHALSRRGLHVSPMGRDGGPDLWLTNADWYFAGAPGAPRWVERRMIIAAAMDRDAVRSRYGEPAVVVPLPGRLDRDGRPIEVWLRPPPGPPFDTARLRDEVRAMTLLVDLRTIDPLPADGR